VGMVGANWPTAGQLKSKRILVACQMGLGAGVEMLNAKEPNMSITKRALEGQISIPPPTQEQMDLKQKLISQHLSKNDQFISDYFDEWYVHFQGLIIQQIHDKFKYKGYKKSYYSKLSAELGGKEELLKFLLVSCKHNSLRYLGYGEGEIKKLLLPFRECGMYMVTYKNSSLSFGTNI
jgi:hypothetical protein